MTEQTKTCTSCGETKTVAEFHKDKSRRDGLSNACKCCNMARIAEWQKANPEKSRANAAKWQKANPEKRRSQDAKWRKANPDKVRAGDAEWRKANPEKRRAGVAKWQKANPDKVRAQAAKWQKANPEKRRATESMRRARIRNAECENGVSLETVAMRDGWLCYICDVETDPKLPPHHPRKAELEHVVPLSRGGSHTFANLKVACHRCNGVKGAHRTPEEVRMLICEQPMYRSAA